MTLRLRPHHLLCLLTYAGKGYSPAFTDNCELVAGRLSEGEEILVVDGPDDVCLPLLGDPAAHCFRDSVAERDRSAAREVGALMKRRIGPGHGLALDAAQIERLRTAFVKGRTRSACRGCEWHDLCTAVAGDGFRAARVVPVRRL